MRTRQFVSKVDEDAAESEFTAELPRMLRAPRDAYIARPTTPLRRSRLPVITLKLIARGSPVFGSNERGLGSVYKIPIVCLRYQPKPHGTPRGYTRAC